jgi:hypothetical protein
MRDCREPAPPEPTAQTPGRLTPEEIEALKRRAKERSAYFKKAFAHLRPKAKD